ncbi:MAG: WD40 repeat/Chromosome segregation ATPase [Verrucomicrobia bacterium]|nr:MAG: WD40 repeat/Chromosome segregation ATPase [Verrucomicrobiota bacterium]
MKNIVFVSFACALGLVAARAADGEKVTFVDHVLPVLESACLNCHNPDEAKGGLDLTTYSATMAGGSGGAVVKAGNPDGSRIVTLTAHTEEPVMPPNKPKIADAQIAILKKWVEGGLLETKDSKAKKSTGPMLAATVEVSAGRPKDPAMPEHVLLQPEVVTARANAITSIAASPWAPLVAIAGQKQVLLYESEHLDLVGILAFPEGFPEDISFSANGSLLVAGGGRGGKYGKAVAWDVKTGERVIEVGKEFDTALAADISPDHGRVALGGPGRNLKIYDTRTGEQLHSIKKHPDWLLELEYSPDGVLLASGGRTGDLYVWEAGSGIEFYELKAHQLAVTGISWRSDSNVLAACSEDGQVSTWEMQKGTNLKKWAAHAGGVQDIDFSPDGSKIVTCGRDNRVKIWDLNGALQREITAFSDIVTAVTFTSDGKRVISGDWNGSLVVWNVADGAKVGELISNPPPIAVQQQRAKESIAKLTAQLPTLEQSVQKAAEAVAAARKPVEEANKVLADARKVKADADAVVKGGEQKAGQADAVAKQAEAKLTESRNLLAAGQKALAEKTAAAAEKRRLVGERAAAITRQTAEAATLRQGFAALEQQLQALVGERTKAEQRVKLLKMQVEQLPDNADLKNQLAQATAALGGAAAAVSKAETGRRDAGAKISGLEKAVADAKAQIPQLEMEAKALDLVVANLPKENAATEKTIAAAAVALDSAKKAAAAARAVVDGSKKALAASDAVVVAKEAAAKAVGDRLNQLAQAESAARASQEKAKVDIRFAQYQVDKWAAAEVNLTLHGENEALGNYRERMISLDEKASAALVERDQAKKALAQAEETLVAAKATIEKGSQYIESAKDDVVENGLALFAARTVNGMLVGETSPMPEGVEPIDQSSLKAITGKMPEIQKTINDTFTKVQSTAQEVQKATVTAQETPKVIAERTKLTREKETTVASLLQEKTETQKTLEEQQRKVEALQKKYESMYYRFGQSASPKSSAPAPAPAPK